MMSKWLENGSPEPPRSRGHYGLPFDVLLGSIWGALLDEFGVPLGTWFWLHVEVPVGVRSGIKIGSKRGPIFE